MATYFDVMSQQTSLPLDVFQAVAASMLKYKVKQPAWPDIIARAERAQPKLTADAAPFFVMEQYRTNPTYFEQASPLSDTALRRVAPWISATVGQGQGRRDR